MTTNSKETVNDNIPLTVRNMEAQALKWPRPPKTCRKIDKQSDWSDSEDGKDDQARNDPTDISPTQDPQPSTSYASESAPLSHPNTYPKVLNLGRGRGKGKFPLSNWTSLAKGCGCRIINGCDIPQTTSTQREPERNLAVVAPTDMIQTYEGDLALAKTRKPLANWTLGRLNNNNIEKIPGQRTTMIIEHQTIQKVQKEMPYILMKMVQIHQDQV